MTDDQSASKIADVDTNARTVKAADPTCDAPSRAPSSAAHLPDSIASHQAATGECWPRATVLGGTDEGSVLPPILHAALAEAWKADAPDLGLAAAVPWAAGEPASELVAATEAAEAATDNAGQPSVPDMVPDDEAQSMLEQDGMSPTSVVQPTPSKGGSMSPAPNTHEQLTQSLLPLQVCTAG